MIFHILSCTQKKNEAITSHFDLVKKVFVTCIWKKNTFFLWDTAGNPEWETLCHLACSGSQSQCRIWFILPAHGADHMIIATNNLSFVTNYDFTKEKNAINN